jgi:hypothetical protein
MATDVQGLDIRLTRHEAVCEIRQQSLLDRVSRIEKFLLTLLVIALGGMGTVIWQLFGIAAKLPLH